MMALVTKMMILLDVRMMVTDNRLMQLCDKQLDDNLISHFVEFVRYLSAAVACRQAPHLTIYGCSVQAVRVKGIKV